MDTDAIRRAATAVAEAETTLRSAAAGPPAVLNDGAFGQSAAGREAVDLLTRRARQIPEGMLTRAAEAGNLADSLTLAALSFELAEAASGPR